MGRTPIPCDAIVYVRNEESSFDTLITENIKELGSISIPSSVITHIVKNGMKLTTTVRHQKSTQFPRSSNMS